MKFNLQISLLWSWLFGSAHGFLPLKSMTVHSLQIEYVLRIFEDTFLQKGHVISAESARQSHSTSAFRSLCSSSTTKRRKSSTRSGVWGWQSWALYGFVTSDPVRLWSHMFTKVCYTSERFGMALFQTWRTGVRSMSWLSLSTNPQCFWHSLSVNQYDVTFLQPPFLCTADATQNSRMSSAWATLSRCFSVSSRNLFSSEYSMIRLMLIRIRLLDAICIFLYWHAFQLAGLHHCCALAIHFQYLSFHLGACTVYTNDILAAAQNVRFRSIPRDHMRSIPHDPYPWSILL